jgi:hypothetical protein
MNAKPMMIITGSRFVHLGKTSDIFQICPPAIFAEMVYDFKNARATKSVILPIASQASIVFFRTFTGRAPVSPMRCPLSFP